MASSQSASFQGYEYDGGRQKIYRTILIVMDWCMGVGLGTL